MFDALKNKFNTATAGFSMSQKATTAVAFVAVVAGVLFFANSASKAVMAPLYTDLTTSEAAAVTEQLREAGYTYELSNLGTTVNIDETKIYEARLLIDRAGIALSGSSDGFSQLDNLGITSTQFQQQVAYQRGLASEIELAIEKMSAISEAEVNLVLPERDLFTNDDIKATASVMLTTDSRLSTNQVSAVVALVAGAVEGLNADQVTVTDQDGNVLSAPGFGTETATSTVERTEQIENMIASDVLTIVEAVVGPGNARVSVNATVNWDQVSTVSETFAPVLNENGEQFMSASSSLVESDTLDVAQGILGSGDVATIEADGSVRADIDADFITDRVIQTTESQGGTITAMTASVVVNDSALTAPQLTSLTTAVAAATGLNVDDGSLAVVALPFDTTAQTALDEAKTAADEAAAAAIAAEKSGQMMRMAVITLLALIAGVITLLSLKKAKKLNEVESPIKQFEELLAGGGPAGALGGATKELSDTTALSAADRLIVVSEERPQDVAELISSWMSEGATR